MIKLFIYTLIMAMVTCTKPDCGSIRCDDGQPCTNDYCVEGDCFHPRVNCDDGLRCTIDDCVQGVCVNIQIQNCVPSCDHDDGDACTHDTIISGMLQCNIPINCDDGEPCTNDFCVNGGCNIVPVNCDDGIFETVDICVEGICFNDIVP